MQRKTASAIEIIRQTNGIGLPIGVFLVEKPDTFTAPHRHFLRTQVERAADIACRLRCRFPLLFFHFAS